MYIWLIIFAFQAANLLVLIHYTCWDYQQAADWVGILCCFSPWSTDGWLCSGTRHHWETPGYGSTAKQSPLAYSCSLIYPFTTSQGQISHFASVVRLALAMLLVTCHSQSVTAVISLTCSQAVESTMTYFQEITLYKWKNLIFFLNGHKLYEKSNISKTINKLGLYKLTLNLFVS